MSDSHLYRFSLRLPREDCPAIKAVSMESGASVNDVLVLAIRKGLDAARQALCRTEGRVCNADPLPEEVLTRIYQQPDEDAESIRLFQRAQTAGLEA
jgi:hypothetical protein